MIDLDMAQHADHVADNIRTVGCRRCAPYIVSETGWEEHRQRVMGQLHECGCATFGPGPHPVDARHPNVRGCEHAEGGLNVELRKRVEDALRDAANMAYDSQWFSLAHECDELVAILAALQAEPARAEEGAGTP